MNHKKVSKKVRWVLTAARCNGPIERYADLTAGEVVDDVEVAIAPLTFHPAYEDINGTRVILL
ncbi:MAG: hypothetical protein AB4042_20600 [Leptolyngbyaceae cyanobacterium]